MTRYLVAIHHPDNHDPSLEDEAMERDIDALNDEKSDRTRRNDHKSQRGRAGDTVILDRA